MAHAVKDLYPDVKIAIGPAIEDGFYYDFEKDSPFSPEDLERIEKKMREIINKNYKFEKEILSKEKAKGLFSKKGEIYKLEILDEIPEDEVSVYRDGDFADLCRGPHIESTGRIKAFKLLSVAGAYWRGDEKNKMLQRIYGTAFNTKEELEGYLKMLEEAKARDHRKLGRELDLFSIQEEWGPGLVFWHPKGAMLRKIIEDFWKKEHLKNGYQFVMIPHIGNADLWQKSGHLEFYKDYMYSPVEIEEERYMIKPMNCPGHILIYKSHTRSYRDLPLRYAELGTVYRYEKSGVLHGLMRVRGFTQDDAHIFTDEERLSEEIVGVLNFVFFMLNSFGFKEYEIYLSTKPEKHVGTDDMWKTATDALEGALKSSGYDYEVDPGEGVFYGPKIDIKIKDAIGRAWQCSTIQVDFNLPEKFALEYIARDGAAKTPIMIHRALFGSLERFVGVLVEHYAGAFPLWLAPVQIAFIPITDAQNEYADKIKAELDKSGFRSQVDNGQDTMQKKIRNAESQKIPYMIIIGKKEVAENNVSVRSKKEKDLGKKNIDELKAMLKQEIKEKGR
jgi:threonyl-tRNA synthetase